MAIGGGIGGIAVIGRIIVGISSLGHYFYPLLAFALFLDAGGGEAEPSGVPSAAAFLYCAVAFQHGAAFDTYSDLLWTSFIGMVVGLVHLLIYLQLAKNTAEKGRVVWITKNGMALAFIIVLCDPLFGKRYAIRKLVSGTFFVITAIGMYAAPLSTMVKILSFQRSLLNRELSLRLRVLVLARNVEEMPLLPLAAAVFYGVAWTMHGFLAQEGVDYVIVVPNLVGTGIAVVTLLLKRIKVIPALREFHFTFFWGPPPADLPPN